MPAHTRWDIAHQFGSGVDFGLNEVSRYLSEQADIEAREEDANPDLIARLRHASDEIDQLASTFERGE